MTPLKALPLTLVLGLAACGGGSVAATPTQTQTPLETAVGSCANSYPGDVEITDDGTSVTAQSKAHGSVKALVCVLVGLGTSEAVITRMDHTNSLMGWQTAEESGYSYGWSYHPDNGFLLVVEESS